MNKICDNLNFDTSFNIDLMESTASGLSLWWNGNVKIEFVHYSKFFIDSLVELPNCDTKVRISWIYGPPYGEDKR